ncbi:MAG: putative two-component hybrid sensor and regulator [Anaerolineaceae bacterium]|nr:MAG: putative two-component hybrid sensor and regulator [Anaerolineaceae bacterium]
MQIRDLLGKLRQIVTPPLFVEEQDKRRAAALYFLLLLLLVASCVLLALVIHQQLLYVVKALLVADALLLFSLILTLLGHYSIPSHLVPAGLLGINAYLVFNGQGIHDIAMLGFPMIIALGGLLLGKRGSLAFAVASILCLCGISWAEINGKTPNTGGFTQYTDFADLFVMALLLGLTAALIYFTANTLSHSLETALKSAKDSRQSGEKLERYAKILETRTGQLMTGARVSRAASSILDPDELAQQVVDMVCTTFELYYVSLFLMDHKGTWAVLHAGSGEAGKEMLRKGHRLKVGSTSMIGWCIANRKARIARDVGRDAVRFDNPLLPLTRSELALPLISRGQIIGALGIQSEKESAFSEEDIATFQAMADQLAIAISNARHYAQLQKELAERKRVEREIRKLNAELEQRVAERTRELHAANEHLTALGRLKDEFIANVSHELRTPITSIMLYHSMIETRPEAAPQYIIHLRRETERLARLIEDLLYISRLEQGRTSLVFDRLDINRLAQDYIADRIPLAQQHALSLIQKLLPSSPIIYADDKMIGQVLSILLTNALNYTPAGGTITIETLAENNQGRQWAGFSVSDTGPGISPEEQKRIFERFFRGNAGRESKTAGTGLGLAIAREIVAKHSGRIEVHSAGIPGQGATFAVWLPITPPQEKT